ncbi:S9 family peptidase [Candidatus Latescibacterota bacterium]
MTRQLRPFGLWDSPVQPHHLSAAVRFRDVAWDGDGRTLVWLEGRGSENVVVCQSRPDQAPRDLTTGHQVRAQVGYGGGEFSVSRGRLFYIETSGRLYVRDLVGGPPRPLTPPFGKPAAPTASPDGGWIVYVHHGEGLDRLAVVDAEGAQWPQILSEGADFYMQPSWHPRGRQLAWVEWDHPQMPWDGTRMVLGEVRRRAGTSPSLTETRVLAGDAGTAVCQPTFSPDGRHLAYVSDVGGWSNVWLYDLEKDQHRCLCEEQADVAVPPWVQGVRVLSFSADGRWLYFTRTESGRRRARRLEMTSGEASAVPELEEYTHVEQLVAAPRGDGLAAVGSSSHLPARILSVRRRQLYVHARSSGETLSAGALSSPRPVSWRADDGTEVHGLHYPPTSEGFDAEGLPPLIVQMHGGPTGQVRTSFDAETQYLATRGYAVLAVNYRGSTGCGRQFMEALRGNWGICDVEDAVGGAQHLVDESLADPSRLVIMGGSAGGYTVLRTMTAKPGYFTAGVCCYGISDLFSLATDTHKFESRYLDSLLGTLPGAAEVYRERSPLFSADQLREPVAIFQGEDDEVVPRAQSDAIVESLRRRNIPHVYRVFEGEGHGWRRPETLEAYIRAVEAFLREHVLFA